MKHNQHSIKWLRLAPILLPLMALLLLAACSGETESPVEGTAVVTEATTVSTQAAAADETSADGETTERSETQFTVSDGHSVDVPRAIAAANPLPDVDTVQIQLKTAVSGSRSPAIVFLENVPRAAGEYTLSRLSFDDPQPGVLEAGVDILDEAAGGVYPYVQFGENVNGTLTITDMADGKMSGMFTFSAEAEGTAVAVSGSFANVTLP